jgi:hypothetical protein
MNPIFVHVGFMVDKNGTAAGFSFSTSGIPCQIINDPYVSVIMGLVQ